MMLPHRLIKDKDVVNSSMARKHAVTARECL